jgi:hypothetical protein
MADPLILQVVLRVLHLEEEEQYHFNFHIIYATAILA